MYKTLKSYHHCRRSVKSTVNLSQQILAAGFWVTWLSLHMPAVDIQQTWFIWNWHQALMPGRALSCGSQHLPSVLPLDISSGQDRMLKGQGQSRDLKGPPVWLFPYALWRCSAWSLATRAAGGIQQRGMDRLELEQVAPGMGRFA